MAKIYKNEDDLVASLIEESPNKIKVKQRQINIYSLVYDSKTEFQYNSYNHEFILLTDDGKYITERPLNAEEFQDLKIKKAIIDFKLQTRLMEDLV